MLSDANKQLVRRLYDDYLNPGLLDRLGEIVSPDFIAGGPQRGPAAFSGVVGGLRAAFPDLRYTVEDLVGDGDRVAVRWSWRGTHTGAFRGFAPTGKQVLNTGFAIFEVTDGRLARAWVETDRLGFLVAIGAVPYQEIFGPPPSAK